MQAEVNFKEGGGVGEMRCTRRSLKGRGIWKVVLDLWRSGECDNVFFCEVRGVEGEVDGVLGVCLFLEHSWLYGWILDGETERRYNDV